MREYSKVSSKFWTGKTGRAMRGRPNLRIAAMYLITGPNANMVGIYYLAVPTMAHETGMSEMEVKGALNALRALEIAYYDAHQEVVYVPAMAKYQIGETLAANNTAVHKGINNQLDQYKGHPFEQDFIVRYGAAYGLKRITSGDHQTPYAVHVGTQEGAETGDLFDKSAPTREPVGSQQAASGQPSGGQLALVNAEQGGQEAAVRGLENPDGGASRSGSGSGAGAGSSPAPGAHARSNGDAEKLPSLPDRMDPSWLRRVFGVVREQSLPGAIAWQGPRDVTGKSQDMADLLNDDRESWPDIVPTMQLLFESAKDGRQGQRSKRILEDPSFGFACWCSGWTGLREELHGVVRVTSVATAAPAQSARSGYVPVRSGKDYRAGLEKYQKKAGG
jgi:hypothetical protein